VVASDNSSLIRPMEREREREREREDETRVQKSKKVL
jgi:hypothetical protein